MRVRERTARAAAATSRGERFPGLRSALWSGAAAVVGTIVIHLYDPQTPGSYGLCPLRTLTGLFCPLCGATRAVHALTHGRWEQAMGLNPVLTLLLPVAVLLWADWVVRSLRGRPTRYAERLGVFTTAVLALVVFTVLRNLPVLEPYLSRLT